MAQRWFHNLRNNSIYSYDDLHLMFMRQFASAKRVGKTPISLMDIRQEPQETLREYVARFNTIALDIPDAESQIKWYAFARGLKQGPLFEALQIKPPTSFEDIMTIIPGYLQLEDAKMARKAEADKLKPKKQDNVDAGEKYIPRNPYRGLPPRIPTMAIEAGTGSLITAQTEKREERGGYRDDLQNPTQWNRHIDEIFHQIKEENYFRAPKDYQPGAPAPGRNNLLCEYHNRYGHLTRECGHLKHQLEILVRKGFLDQYIERPRGSYRENRYDERREDERRRRDGTRRDHDDRERRHIHEERREKRNHRQDSQDRHNPANHAQYDREVHMITGENNIPTSNRAKKQLARTVRSGYYDKAVMTINTAPDEPIISFGPKDARSLFYPHDDALVFSANVANVLVHRIFVDSGSAVNILYLECW
ncbi:uncharacterized protein LOC131018642 [Salvia miltiorrhiza]|uniref:uncharacterized protein LOC131018642 n=1 Tax=Salvia miltiorrhiza TaxID=226208 RepID=UPI0025AC0552|nr:uncharacterized protein LOC131018642 [Salvia miltiorrhiza]